MLKFNQRPTGPSSEKVASVLSKTQPDVKAGIDEMNRLHGKLKEPMRPGSAPKKSTKPVYKPMTATKK